MATFMETNCYARKKSLNVLLPGPRIWVALKRLNGTAPGPVKNGATFSAIAASLKFARSGWSFAMPGTSSRRGIAPDPSGLGAAVFLAAVFLAAVFFTALFFAFAFAFAFAFFAFAFFAFFAIRASQRA